MDCRNTRARIVAWQDEELSPGEDALVREHVLACGSCRAHERRLRRVTPRPFLQVPAQLQSELWDRLDQAVDAAARQPAPPAPVARPWAQLWARRTPVPTAMLALYGILLAISLGWGLHNWTLLHVGVGAPVVASGPEVVSIPGDQYQSASWKPAPSPAP